MDLMSWLRLLGAALALGIVTFGAAILATGRAPRRELKAFRAATDAGKYYVLYGLAVLIFIAGVLDMWPSDVFSLLATALAVALAGLATFRYRLRRNPAQHDSSDKSASSS